MSRSWLCARYMRGGSRKGVFFHARDLPAAGPVRDTMLARLVGSPDAQGRFVDGIGGAGPDANRLVLVWPSLRDDCDVEYLVGDVVAGARPIDWDGDCCHLLAAVGPFAVDEGLVPACEGITTMRIRHAGSGRRTVAHVPVRNGGALEDGSFRQDGVPTAGAEIRLELLEPAGVVSGEGGAGLPLLPTGAVQDRLDVPGIGELAVTLVDAGQPTVFVRAAALGLSGRESAEQVERNRKLLARLDAIRASAAASMWGGAAASGSAGRPAGPDICWVTRPAGYRASSGIDIAADSFDLLARVLSAGGRVPADGDSRLLALAAAAALPGSLVHEIVRTLPGVPTRIGLWSGAQTVGVEMSQRRHGWQVDKLLLSRSARRLMSGWVHAPSAAAGAKP